MPLLKEEIVKKRLYALKNLASPCRLCPRQCKVSRLKGEIGFCRSPYQVKIASWALHHGEEPPISGIKGSGTIFSSNCTLCCVFCQNFPFSQLGNGIKLSSDQLAEKMDEVAQKGAHNLNFVTPTHAIPFFLESWLKTSKKNQKIANDLQYFRI